MAIRRPSLTNEQQRDELARKLVELVDEANALLVRMGAAETMIDADTVDIAALEASRVEGRGAGVVNALAVWTSGSAIGANANASFNGTDLTIANRLATSDPTVTLQTGLSARVNVAAVKTTPRIMMGPTQNVGNALQLFTFAGLAAAGPVAVPGTVVGDVVRQLQGIAPLHIMGSGAAQFEAVISVANQIQQTGAGLGAQDFIMLLERRSATGATTERPLYVVP